MLGEGAGVDQTSGIADRLGLGFRILPPAAATEAAGGVIVKPFGRVIVRTLPAVHLPHLRAGRDLAIIGGGGAQRPAGFALFIGMVQHEDMLIAFLVLFRRVFGGHPAAETARIKRRHVDLGLARRHHLGKVMADAAGSGDAKGKALGQPHVAQARRGTDQRVAVGRVADRAVEIVFQPHGFRGRNPVDHRHVFFLDPLQIQREQVGAEGFRHIVKETRRGVALIRAKDPAAALFADIPFRIGVAQNGVFGVAGGAPCDQRRVRLGHDILMLDGDRGDLDAQQTRGALRVVAGGGHDMFGMDVEHLARGDEVAALFHHAFAGDDPFVAGPEVGIDLNATLDGSARHARALGHGLGHVGGVDIAVGRVKQRAFQILGADQRPALLDLGGRQEFMLDADGLGGGGIKLVFVHPRVGLGHAQVAAAGETGVQPGFRLKPGIKLDRIVMDMAGRVTHVEQRQKSGRVPGRARRQLVTFDQHRVPAGLGQMIGDAAADRAASDHKGLHMGLHSSFPPVGRAFPSLCQKPRRAGSCRRHETARKRHRRRNAQISVIVLVEIGKARQPREQQRRQDQQRQRPEDD